MVLDRLLDESRCPKSDIWIFHCFLKRIWTENLTDESKNNREINRRKQSLFVFLGNVTSPVVRGDNVNIKNILVFEQKMEPR